MPERIAVLFVFLFLGDVFLTLFKLIVWFYQFLAPLADNSAGKKLDPSVPLRLARPLDGVHAQAMRISGKRL